nr:hypothetical protein [Tanacetum cinerariifolium]
LGVKEERNEAYLIGWVVMEEVCQHTRRAVTIVLVQEKWNPFPGNVTMKGHPHDERKHSRGVKIADEDTGSQDHLKKI